VPGAAICRCLSVVLSWMEEHKPRTRCPRDKRPRQTKRRPPEKARRPGTGLTPRHCELARRLAPPPIVVPPPCFRNRPRRRRMKGSQPLRRRLLSPSRRRGEQHANPSLRGEPAGAHLALWYTTMHPATGLLWRCRRAKRGGQGRMQDARGNPAIVVGIG
jgi:hypothetical protein